MLTATAPTSSPFAYALVPISAAGLAPSVPEHTGARCSTCAMQSLCMPSDLSAPELARLDSMISTSRQIKRGEALYRAGDAFRSVYAVRAGCFKTVIMHRDGQEQVTGFHLAGEVLGLDGVSADRHGCDAIALEDSTVCIIPFHLLESVCHDVKAMQHHLHRMMSGEIVRESGLMLLLGTMTAEQRLAAFLLNLSTRMKARGYSASEFSLRMTREEIGSYLGMKLETVSRMFSKLHKEGVLDTRGKLIRILNPERLAEV
jgi:CRP/FNR family transcriptional regulator, anaerobic regulatory protein